ncbi:hypothetical protein D5F01_LYC20678 [Larimichthys crocea]|uniref:Craniofacial development protein 2 n=1 Tax=Larimichthys crocea TaxID=215358 RepID=A0A6G0HR29_LARCR|nr:hypothetical protein D5F01_LYC20678 [Larimichthys crocea]
MSLKLEIEGVMFNVVSGYAPQVGCELEEKEKFWLDLDEVMQSIPRSERVVICADFNGHVGAGNRDDEEVMGRFGIQERNAEGQMVVDFAKRIEMAVVNTFFQKRQEHRVTCKSRVDKETWWWNEEVKECVRRKRLAKKKWDTERTDKSRQEYREMQHKVRVEVAKAKQGAYDDLYASLDSKEGETDLYRLARQRDRDGKDMQHFRMIKDMDGSVLTGASSVMGRWKENFEELMNEENERERRAEEVTVVDQEVAKISEDEVRRERHSALMIYLWRYGSV